MSLNTISRHVCGLLALGMTAFPVSSYATTPPEVLDAYRAYVAAVEAGDSEAALENAKLAYETGRTLMGETEQTAVLAHNYAEILFDADPEEAVTYFRRAIELTPNDSQANRELNAERHVRIGQSWLRIPDLPTKNIKKLKRDFAASLDFMVENDMLETTFGAEALVLNAVRLYLNEDMEEAVADIDRALAIFDSPAHTVVSPLRYEAHLLKGDILKNDDKPIEAALSYQVVMQNLEGDVSADHPFINSAFHRWMQARGVIGAEGLTEEAIEAGICKCWPYDEMSAHAPLPKHRVPPKMPSRAWRSGHVMVIFDVDRSGQPYNIRARGATDKVFLNPALRSVKQWKYEISDELADEDLKGIVTKISFVLYDERGRVVPGGEIKMMPEAG